jgi:hypothetical protein
LKGELRVALPDGEKGAADDDERQAEAYPEAEDAEVEAEA